MLWCQNVEREAIKNYLLKPSLTSHAHHDIDDKISSFNDDMLVDAPSKLVILVCIGLPEGKKLGIKRRK